MRLDVSTYVFGIFVRAFHYFFAGPKQGRGPGRAWGKPGAGQAGLWRPWPKPGLHINRALWFYQYSSLKLRFNWGPVQFSEIDMPQNTRVRLGLPRPDLDRSLEHDQAFLVSYEVQSRV